MEQVGGRGTKTNVDREGPIINEVKNGGNKVDNVHDNQGEDEAGKLAAIDTALVPKERHQTQRHPTLLM